ncbi:hypothetical protein BaRGS_00020852, partial [Batillaria attramentaria]
MMSAAGSRLQLRLQSSSRRRSSHKAQRSQPQCHSRFTPDRAKCTPAGAVGLSIQRPGMDGTAAILDYSLHAERVVSLQSDNGASTTQVHTGIE